MDIVKEKRRQRFEEEQTQSEELITKLNRERARLVDQELQLQQRKRQHRALVSKGLDFLSEIELGHAPPVEFLVANHVDDDVSEKPSEQSFGINIL